MKKRGESRGKTKPRAIQDAIVCALAEVLIDVARYLFACSLRGLCPHREQDLAILDLYLRGFVLFVLNGVTGLLDRGVAGVCRAPDCHDKRIFQRWPRDVHVRL